MNTLEFSIILLTVFCAAIFVVTVNQIQTTKITTAITDNGCSSHQELKPTKTRIENYNLTNL